MTLSHKKDYPDIDYRSVLTELKNEKYPEHLRKQVNQLMTEYENLKSSQDELRFRCDQQKILLQAIDDIESNKELTSIDEAFVTLISSISSLFSVLTSIIKIARNYFENNRKSALLKLTQKYCKCVSGLTFIVEQHLKDPLDMKRRSKVQNVHNSLVKNKKKFQTKRNNTCQNFPKSTKKSCKSSQDDSHSFSTACNVVMNESNHSIFQKTVAKSDGIPDTSAARHSSITSENDMNQTHKSNTSRSTVAKSIGKICRSVKDQTLSTYKNVDGGKNTFQNAESDERPCIFKSDLFQSACDIDVDENEDNKFQNIVVQSDKRPYRSKRYHSVSMNESEVDESSFKQSHKRSKKSNSFIISQTDAEVVQNKTSSGKLRKNRRGINGLTMKQINNEKDVPASNSSNLEDMMKPLSVVVIDVLKDSAAECNPVVVRFKKEIEGKSNFDKCKEGNEMENKKCVVGLERDDIEKNKSEVAKCKGNEMNNSKCTVAIERNAAKNNKCKIDNCENEDIKHVEGNEGEERECNVDKNEGSKIVEVECNIGKSKEKNKREVEKSKEGSEMEQNSNVDNSFIMDMSITVCDTTLDHDNHNASDNTELSDNADNREHSNDNYDIKELNDINCYKVLSDGEQSDNISVEDHSSIEQCFDKSFDTENKGHKKGPSTPDSPPPESDSEATSEEDDEEATSVCSSDGGDSSSTSPIHGKETCGAPSPVPIETLRRGPKTPPGNGPDSEVTDDEDYA